MARQLTAYDALGAHAEAEPGIDPDDLVPGGRFAMLVTYGIGSVLGTHVG